MIHWPWAYKPTGRELYWWEIEPIIKPWKHPGLAIGPADKRYILPDDPYKLIQKYRSRKRYIKEKRDCDDYVRILRGNLSEAGLGHIFCAACLVRWKNGNHPGAGFIGRDDRLHVWDLQKVEMIRDYRILGLWL